MKQTPTDHIAVVYNRADAEALGSVDAADQVLSLSPDALGSIDSESHKPISSTALFSRYGHARALVRRRHLHQALAAIDLPSLKHGDILKNYILNQLDQSVSFVARLEETFRHFPDGTRFTCRTKAGEWQTLAGRYAIVDFLYQRLSPEDDAASERKSLFAPGLYRLFVIGVLHLIRNRGAWCVCTQTGLPFGMDAKLYAEPNRIRRLVIQFGAETRSYARLALRLVEFLRNDSSTFVIEIPAQSDPATGKAVSTALGNLADVVSPETLALKKRSVADATAEIIGASAFVKRMIDVLKPKAVISYQTSSKMEHTVSAAAERASLLRLVLNYNSHTLSKGACSEFSNHGHFRLKVWNALTDRVLTWSPSNAALVTRLRDETPGKSITAIRALTALPEMVAQDGLASREAPVVLHAGSFLSWDRTLLWCLETSDEYAESILAFAEAAKDVKGINAIVRCKKKGEGGGDAIGRLLPADSPVTLQGLERPFAEVLLEVTVLISFMSTVIEEALAARTPVILWGPTDRYLHLSPQWAPPTGIHDRAAVYAAADTRALATLITAVVAAHANTPLTDDEIAPYVFDAAMPGTDSISEWICTGTFPEWQGTGSMINA